MLFLIASITLLHFQSKGFDQQVTFECRATRAKNLMPKLSQLTGIKFESDRATGNEVLLIKVKEVPLKDLTAQIAEAASGQWVKDEDIYRLERSSELEKNLREKERKLIARRIVETCNDTAKANEVFDKELFRTLTESIHAALLAFDQHDPDFNRQVEDIKRLYFQYDRKCASPGRRLLGKILKGALLPRLYSLGTGERIVLSTKPTAFQERLPMDADALREYIRERDYLSAALSGFSPADIKAALDIALIPADSTLPIDKLLLTVKRSIEGTYFRYCLYALAQNGAILDQVDFDANLGVPSENPLCSKSAVVAVSCQLAPDMRKLNDWLIACRDQSQPIPSDFKPKLLYPETLDPLSMLSSDFWLNLVVKDANNIVASLPDSVLLPGSDSEDDADSGKALFKLDLESPTISASIDHNWLIVKPLCPVSCATDRLNREAYGTLARAVVAKGYTSLLDLSRFANAANEETYDFAINNPDSPLSYYYDTFQYRFHPSNGYKDMVFGSMLTSSQINTLLDGKTIEVGELSPIQRLRLNNLVFKDISWMLNPAGSKYCSEPTEVLPYGLPPDAFITMETTSMDEVLSTDPDEDGFYGNIRTLAEQINNGDKEIEAQRFWIGHIKHMAIDLKISNGSSINFGLTDRLINRLLGPLLPGQFPSEHQKALQSEIKELRDKKSKLAGE